MCCYIPEWYAASQHGVCCTRTCCSRTNAFLKNTRDEKALTYDDISIQESYHVSQVERVRRLLLNRPPARERLTHFTLFGSQAFVLMRHEDSNVFSAFDTKQLDDVRFAGCVHARCYDTLRGVSRGSRALICSSDGEDCASDGHDAPLRARQRVQGALLLLYWSALPCAVPPTLPLRPRPGNSQCCGHWYC